MECFRRSYMFRVWVWFVVRQLDQSLLCIQGFSAIQRNGSVERNSQVTSIITAAHYPRRCDHFRLYNSNLSGKENIKGESQEDESSSQQPNEDLARKFYDFQKGQEEANQPRDGDSGEANDDETTSRTDSTTGRLFQPPDDRWNTQPIKFTGRPQSLFSELTDEGNRPAALSAEQEREFNLAGTFERTLPIQAGVVAICLAFVLYVGITGGITSGGVDGLDDDCDYDSYYYYDSNGQIWEEPAQCRNTVRRFPPLPSEEGEQEKNVDRNENKDIWQVETKLPESVWL